MINYSGTVEQARSLFDGTGVRTGVIIRCSDGEIVIRSDGGSGSGDDSGSGSGDDSGSGW